MYQDEFINERRPAPIDPLHRVSKFIAVWHSTSVSTTNYECNVLNTSRKTTLQCFAQCCKVYEMSQQGVDSVNVVKCFWNVELFINGRIVNRHSVLDPRLNCEHVVYHSTENTIYSCEYIAPISTVICNSHATQSSLLTRSGFMYKMCSSLQHTEWGCHTRRLSLKLEIFLNGCSRPWHIKMLALFKWTRKRNGLPPNSDVDRIHQYSGCLKATCSYKSHIAKMQNLSCKVLCAWLGESTQTLFSSTAIVNMGLATITNFDDIIPTPNLYIIGNKKKVLCFSTFQ